MKDLLKKPGFGAVSAGLSEETRRGGAIGESLGRY